MSNSSTIDYAKIFFKGFRTFKKTGKTPFESFMALRNLFVKTNGRFNDWCARILKITRGKLKNINAVGVLGNLATHEVEEIVGRLKEDGYYIFPQKLSREIINDVYQFCLNEPAPYLKVEENPSGFKIEFSQDKIQFNSKAPVSPRYQFESEQVFLNRNLQKLFFDQSILAIANEYFGCRPIADSVALWWSAPYHQLGKSESAQLFHFDMDKIKFLKFFFYLNDVGPGNGPHCYVRGSHRRLPLPLLRDGRKNDEEVYSNYQSSDIMEITGEKGTIIAVDTRGLHKGKDLQDNYRLLFQIEFAVSMFGADYPSIDFKLVEPEFHSLVEKYPEVYKPIFGRSKTHY